ncbi:PIN domain-containing protein [Pseudomonas sp. S2_E02]
MSLIYISDTNIWIDFRNAGLLEQMFRLPFTLCCTDFVMQELEDFPHDELLDQGLIIESLDEASVMRLYGLRVEHNNSSLADVSCYLLAQETRRPLLTGDGRLRRQAQRDGL